MLTPPPISHTVYVEIFVRTIFCEYGKKSRKRKICGNSISRIMNLPSCNVQVYTLYAEIFAVFNSANGEGLAKNMKLNPQRKHLHIW